MVMKACSRRAGIWHRTLPVNQKRRACFIIPDAYGFCTSHNNLARLAIRMRLGLDPYTHSSGGRRDVLEPWPLSCVKGSPPVMAWLTDD